MLKYVFAAIAALAVSAGAASGQEVKVGIVLPFTGVNAEFVQQMDRGIELYLIPFLHQSELAI
jgi:ABC-type branched-subunit amino acid transport system substrate-binding protein